MTESQRSALRAGLETITKSARESKDSIEDNQQRDASVRQQVKSALTDAQVKRFRELECQLAGMLVLQYRSYADLLGLTAAQQTQIEEVIAFSSILALEQHRAIFTARSDAETPQLARQLITLSWQMDERILEILTPQQRNTWLLCVGEPVTWPLRLTHISLSRDGSQFVFAGTITGLSNVVGICRSDGTGQRLLLDNGELPKCPAFSPDDQSILVSTTHNGKYDLCSIDVKTAICTYLGVSHLRPDEGGRYSRDGMQIVFGVKSGVAVLNVATRHVEIINGHVSAPAFNSDDTRVIGQKAKDMYETIVPDALTIVNVKTRTIRDLPIIGYSPQVTMLNEIVFLSGSDGQQDVYKATIEGKDQKRLTTSGGKRRSLSMSADNHYLACLEYDDTLKRWQVVVLANDGRHLRTVGLVQEAPSRR